MSADNSGVPAESQGSGGEGNSAGSGLDPKVGGLLSYLLSWIAGLVMLLTQSDKEVRFHGAQSVLYAIALVVVYVALTVVGVVLGQLPAIGGLLQFLFSVLLSGLVGLGSFVLWIFLCIKGYNLEHFKLPFVGDIAEQWAGMRS
jgi:uncharacterized membrane protein